MSLEFNFSSLWLITILSKLFDRNIRHKTDRHIICSVISVFSWKILLEASVFLPCWVVASSSPTDWSSWIFLHLDLRNSFLLTSLYDPLFPATSAVSSAFLTYSFVLWHTPFTTFLRNSASEINWDWKFRYMEIHLFFPHTWLAIWLGIKLWIENDFYPEMLKKQLHYLLESSFALRKLIPFWFLISCMSFAFLSLNSFKRDIKISFSLVWNFMTACLELVLIFPCCTKHLISPFNV